MKDILSVVGGLFVSKTLRMLSIGLATFLLLSFSVQAEQPFDFFPHEDVASEYKPPLNSPSEREVVCLAKNIYFEARGEPYLGQKAVAFVTMNRVQSGKFPDDVCGVVYQRIQQSCQFEWACRGNLRVVDSEAFARAKTLALKVLTMYNELTDPSKGALYFHAVTVQTMIQKSRTTALIGQHRFYK